MIRYNSILSDSIVDGSGLRVVAFLQGCPRRCEGCHNPHSSRRWRKGNNRAGIG